MSDYDRTTRECAVSELQPELLQAVRLYCEQHALGDLETETLACCETISQKKNTSRLRSWLQGEMDTTVHLGLILTPQYLIWVRRGDRSGPGVTAARLTQIRARAITSLLTHDTGLEISGYVGDSARRIQGFLGLEAGPAAQKFCDAVVQEITKVNPSSKKGPFSWFGS